MFTCPECRATFETFEACQSHRLDPYGRKARGEQAKDGRFPEHDAKPAYPPVQLCPICGCAGEFVGPKCGPLALDAECTSCGWFYTTTARRAVLAALSR